MKWRDSDLVLCEAQRLLVTRQFEAISWPNSITVLQLATENYKVLFFVKKFNYR